MDTRGGVIDAQLKALLSYDISQAPECLESCVWIVVTGDGGQNSDVSGKTTDLPTISSGLVILW